MTWICAASNVIGSCALYSDVQVTLKDGRTRDLLQKAYPITNSIAAGFAGSVEIGFVLLQSLTDFLRLPNWNDQVGWDPRSAAVNWAPIAKALFGKAPVAERALGSKILMAAASPNENCGLSAKTYLVRFSEPDFQPGIMGRPFKLCSIGSGARFDEYHKRLKPLFRWEGHIRTLQAQVGDPNGWARHMGFRISRSLARHPHSGISRHIHIIIVRRGATVVETNDENIYRGDDPRIEIRMPKVAQGLVQFRALAAAAGHDAAGAVC
jgi:hypothetical protein